MQVIIDIDDPHYYLIKYKQNRTRLKGKENILNEPEIKPPPPVTMPEVEKQLLKRSNDSKRRIKCVKILEKKIEKVDEIVIGE